MSRNLAPGKKPEYADMRDDQLIDVVAGEYGSGSRLLTLFPPDAWTISRLPPEELARRGNIPTESATRLAAALELAYRVREQRAEARPDMGDTTTTLTWLWERGTMLDQEEAWVLLLDAQQHLIASKLLAIGTRKNVALDAPTVLRVAIEHGADTFVLLHNHVDGPLYPSTKDIAFTLDLQRAAEFVQVRLLDHYIIGRDRKVISILDWVADEVKKAERAKEARKAARKAKSRKGSKASTPKRRPR